MEFLCRYPDLGAETELKNLISMHLAATGSAKAWQMLEDWEGFRPKFVRVFPVEYRRALEEQNKHGV